MTPYRYFATKAREGKRKWLRALVWFCLATLLSIIAGLPLTLTIEQNTSLRWLFSWRGERSPPPNLALVMMHGQAAEHLSLPSRSSHWPRTLYGDVITRLHQAGARLIVLDVAFREARDEEEDAYLAEALRQAGNVLLFTYLKRYQVPTGQGWADIEQVIPPAPQLFEHALGSGPFILPRFPERVTQAELRVALPGGESASQPLLAYLALQPPAMLHLWSTHYPASESPGEDYRLGGQLARLFHSVQSHSAHTSDHTVRSSAHSSDRQPEQLFPLQNGLTPQQLPNPLTLNFYGPARTISTWDLHQVMQSSPNQLSQWFSGKVVFVGYGEPRQTEQQDVYRTVFSDRQGVDLSGVEISATALANLIAQDYLRPAPAWLRALLTVCAFGLSALLCRSPWRWPALALLGTGYVLLSHWVFVRYFWWWPITLPLAAMAFGAAVYFAERFQQIKRRAAAITRTLQHYLPEHAAQRLSHNIAALEHQHEMVHGICLMTDVQGYTRLSETLPPNELHQLMNRYYAELIAEVKHHGGFVANLVGDSLTALWVGPSIDTTLCQNALNCARAINQRINQQSTYAATLPTCIALHGGKFSLGNLGAAGHFEYSPVGDIINTTARVEHFNRTLNTRILCTDAVAAPVLAQGESADSLKYLGSYQFRNKNNPTELYTPQPDRSDSGLTNG